MAISADAAALTDYLARRQDAYLEELRQLCAIECPTSYKPGVDEAGTWVRGWVAGRGWELRVWPDESAGDGLLITLPGGDPQGARLLLAAHLDTVYPVGIAAERPVRCEGDRLIGPGSADNKSGLLSGLFAMAALEDTGLLEQVGAISLMCGGDEETDMHGSLAMMHDAARDYDAALVLEAGRENGDIVAARKGIGSWTLEVQGKQAHAGVEPHKGANAILALAQQIVALHLLNGMRPGVSLNVGVIAGGTVTNVVPDTARAELEARVVATEDMEPVAAALAQIVASTYVPGTTATLTGGWRYPPMPRTAATDALAAQATACAGELGFDVTAAATGGASYANSFASLGLPVLDGLGPVGGLDHSADEYILVSSIVPRTAMLALLVLRYAQQAPNKPIDR